MVDPQAKKEVAQSLLEITNRTQNDFRQRLSDFSQSVAATQLQTPRITERPPPPNITTETQQFDPQPLTLANLEPANSNNNPGGGGTSASLLGWETVFAKFGSDWNWAVVLGYLEDTQSNGAASIAVTGALTPGPISPSDPAWSKITSASQDSSGAYIIWAEVAFGTWPAVNSAYINTTNYDGGKLEYAFDASTPPNAIQTFARFILARVPAFNSDGSPQYETSGISMLKLVNDGDTAFDSGGIGSNPQPCPIIRITAG